MLILSSCLTALLAMVLLGAPLEDHAIRTGSVAAPSGFSRVSWYVFPLLAAIFQVLAFIYDHHSDVQASIATVFFAARTPL